ncbi:MAG: AAA family ATPase [Bacteroidales bacterium]|nr:AAA family ATPase [Bacteroidales bacterium]
MKLNHLITLTPNKECEPVTTGFQHLDHLIGGLRTGQICTVAARPGMGKTAFAVSLLRNIGVVQKVPTAYLSLDLTELEIVRRLKASITGRLESVPKPSAEMMDVMNMIGFHYRDIDQAAIQSIKEAPVWIEDDLEADIDEIVRRMGQLRQENQVRLVIIDSISLLMLGRNPIEQTQVIKKLYETAGRLEQAVILTSPENSSQEVSEGCKCPRLSDLCNWEQIGSFSSVVMFVYRPEYYYFEIFEDDCDSYDFELSENGITHLYRICDTFEDGTTAIEMADIMVEKNDYGDIGFVRMHFENHVSFREISYEDMKKPHLL